MRSSTGFGSSRIFFGDDFVEFDGIVPHSFSKAGFSGSQGSDDATDLIHLGPGMGMMRFELQGLLIQTLGLGIFPQLISQIGLAEILLENLFPTQETDLFYPPLQFVRGAEGQGLLEILEGENK